MCKKRIDTHIYFYVCNRPKNVSTLMLSTQELCPIDRDFSNYYEWLVQTTHIEQVDKRLTFMQILSFFTFRYDAFQIARSAESILLNTKQGHWLDLWTNWSFDHFQFLHHFGSVYKQIYIMPSLWHHAHQAANTTVKYSYTSSSTMCSYGLVL